MLFGDFCLTGVNEKYSWETYIINIKSKSQQDVCVISILLLLKST